MRRAKIASMLAVSSLVAAQPALAGPSSVDPSHSGMVVVPVTVQQLAPPACAALGLTTLVVTDPTVATTPSNGNGSGNGGNGNGNGGGSGGGVTTVRGTNGNDLVLGSPGRDRMDGRQGTDCLVGGAGDDHLDGGQDQDVCSPGADPGDTTANCEVVA